MPLDGSWEKDLGGGMVFTPTKVFLNGTVQNAPVIASGNAIVTSTGATGVYAINFAPAVFNTVPNIVAWVSTDFTNGNICILDFQAVTTLLFQFSLAEFLPAVGAVPVGNQVRVEWIAAGS